MSARGASQERSAELLARVLPRERIGSFAARAGLPSRPEAAPGTAEEALEVLRLAHSERWTIAPLGNGSKLAWLRPPERVDLYLSSRNLRGIAAYEPADGTLTAAAGTPWPELVAATHVRHHLSPELAGAAAATLGGTLAAGANGFDRLRHGPVRHQVLGMLALHADGTRVKSGGRVVKNVTGYDLHRLWCGSRGTLCFLLEATLRLYPAPAAHALLRARCADLAQGLAQSHALLRAGLAPVAVVLHSSGAGNGRARGGAELAVVLAGRPEAVAGELAATQRAIATHELLCGDEALRARAELREGELRGGRWAPLVLACRPSRLAAVLAQLCAATDGLGLATELTLHPLLAEAFVEFPGTALEDERLAALAERLAGGDFTPRWRGLGARQPPAAVSAAAALLMQRLKQALDPAGLFAGTHA